jgi:hypothetical protein
MTNRYANSRPIAVLRVIGLLGVGYSYHQADERRNPAA